MIGKKKLSLKGTFQCRFFTKNHSTFVTCLKRRHHKFATTLPKKGHHIAILRMTGAWTTLAKVSSITYDDTFWATFMAKFVVVLDRDRLIWWLI